MLTVAVSTAVAAAVTSSAGNCTEDPARLSLTGVDLGQAVVAILAVLTITSEYSTGMIRVTLAAMPRRTAVLAAKAVVLTALVAGGRRDRGARVASWPGSSCCPATASTRRTDTRRCPSAAARCCAPRPDRCSTWP